MPGTETQKPAYRFGSFELDNHSGDLRKGGVRIKLQEQPRRILVLLLEHPGEVLTREQIQKNLWPDDTFVDFDNAINSAVRRLRDVLSDTAENPRFIETVARRGYRFLAPVSSTDQSPPEPAARPVISVADVPVAVVPVPKKRKWLFVASAVVTFILAALAVPKLVRTSGNGEIANTLVVPLTSNAGTELQPSFSPDGTRIAYVWNGVDGKNFSIYVKLIGAGDPVRITRDAARDFSPAWSPDGRWIAALRDFGSEGAIILIPASGGQHRELTRVAKARPMSNACFLTASPQVCGLTYGGPLLAWSQDGKYLFTSGYSKPDSALNIIRISVETGEQSPITAPPAGITGDLGPGVSPDGRELAFVRVIGAKTGDLYVLSLDGESLSGAGLSGASLANAQPRRITFDSVDLESPAWTRDGRELIFSSDRGSRRELWRVEASGSGRVRRVAGMGENASDLAISPGGQRLVYSRGSYFGSLWKIPIEGGKGGVPVRVTATTARDKFTHFSPDGKRIAFQSGRSGVDEIWVCDADGTNAVQLTSFGKGMSGSPRWSPDGKNIAFDSNVAGSWEIYSVRSDGGRPIRVTNSPPNAVVPNWSRDGKWIYFTSTRSGRGEIWKIRPDGSSGTQVITGGADTAIESADGNYLYFTRGALSGGDDELWKMALGGGTPTKVLDSVSGRLYTITQKGIYFAARDPELELRYLNFANGSVHSIGRLGTFAHADVSSDERWALYPEPGNTGNNLMLSDNFR
jgi:Tol biopolymer transport system component/DNA-binding winged helix-turn-helix (wHTH) protein